LGADISFVRSQNGRVSIGQIRRKVKTKTKTILTSHVQYSTGFKQDLIDLGRLAREKGLYLVVNGTQSIGALRFDVKRFNVDFMASDGHKWMLSSYGVGVLYIRSEYLQNSAGFKPPFYSYLGQKNKNIFNNQLLDISKTASRFELGSPHFPNIFALNAAIKYILNIGMISIEKRIQTLVQYLIEKLREINLSILSPVEVKHRSGIVIFKSSNAEHLVSMLKKDGIIVSARGGGVRISPHFYNNEEDIDKLVLSLKHLI
jgi:selenocysteine lyase/cysteine desulfurase